METQFQRISTGLFASAGQLFWNRFTGPGRIGLQSMSVHLPSGDGGGTQGGSLSAWDVLRQVTR